MTLRQSKIYNGVRWLNPLLSGDLHLTTRTLTAKPEPLKVKLTEDGLHVVDTILWLDSHSCGELSFFSSATKTIKTQGPQVIATEETIKILEAFQKKPNALVCQYNRPFSIGRLKMELLPSGSVLGGASLFVEKDSTRFLYAPCVQSQKIPSIRQMQLKKATTLILQTCHPDPMITLPNRKKEKERLLEAVARSVSSGKYPLIFCPPVGIAQEITELLTEQGFPVSVHDHIFRINRVYESFGAKLGNYTKFSLRYTKRKVVIFHLPEGSDRMSLKRPLPEGPIFYVEESSTPSNPPTAFRDVAERFFVNQTVSGSELKEIITTVNPKEVYFFGPYAKRYSEELKGVCSSVKPLFCNDQPTLL